MLRFLKAFFRFPGSFYSRLVIYHRPYSGPGGAYAGLRIPPEAGAEEPSTELDLNLMDADEPQEHLPHAEITEAEREEAVRRYQRKLAE